MRVDHPVELVFELLFAFRRAVRATRHILPDEHPEPISPVIPSFGLHLDMFAREIESEGSHYFDIVAEGGVGRCSQDAVGPEALVKGADLEEWCSIQLDPLKTTFIAAQRDLSHAEVTSHGINGFASAYQGNGEVVDIFRGVRGGTQSTPLESWLTVGNEEIRKRAAPIGISVTVSTGDEVRAGLDCNAPTIPR